MGEKLKEANLPNSQDLLNQDFALARSLGARGFPTIIIVNEENKGVKIVVRVHLNTMLKDYSKFLN